MNNNCNKSVAHITKANSEQLEHYTLFPLPDNRKGPSSTYFRKTIAFDSGEVVVFEFDFVVPHLSDISWEDLERSVPHRCETCEWDFCRGKNAVYCPSTNGEHRKTCDAWDLSPDAIRLAQSEYYKALHEKHYGTACVSV